MPVFPVFVEDWQHECCGEPFGVGDTVAWRLGLGHDPDGMWGWPDEMLVELRPTGRRESGEQYIVTLASGLQVAVGRSAVTEGGVVRGTLTEDHHGVVPDEVRPVEGVVRRLRVVRQRKRRHDRSWTPVAGAVELRDVRTMPDAFESFDPEARESWTELGALADLEVA
jgi:hypothetical protein